MFCFVDCAGFFHPQMFADQPNQEHQGRSCSRRSRRLRVGRIADMLAWVLIAGISAEEGKGKTH